MILNPKYDFLKADYMNANLTTIKPELDTPKSSPKSRPKSFAALFSLPLLIMPNVAFAAETTTSTFDNVFDAVMTVFDYGVVLVIVFAGAAWSLGHRSKAIELLIGVACGYLLARKAVDIRDFLKSI